MVDGEEDGERDQAVLAKIEDLVGAGLAEANAFFVDVGVLVELGETFIEPDWQPLRLAQNEVRVLVIDDGIGVLALGVETQQDVVAVGRAQEKAGEIDRPLGEIRRRFERHEALLVFERHHRDGKAGVAAGLGQDFAEETTHALELPGNACGPAFRWSR